METTILTDILTLFRDAILPWGNRLGEFMRPLLTDLAVISWIFMLLAEVCAPALQLFPSILRFMLGLGFVAGFLDLGPIWTADLFFGVGVLAGALGAPAPDPSSIAGFGLYVTKPILDQLADQGWFWWSLSPTSWVMGGTVLLIVIAFWALALQLLALLILSYFLIVTGPFFMVFAAAPWTRGMAFSWCRWVVGCLSGLFCILVLSAHIASLSDVLQSWLSDGLDSTRTIGWGDLAAIGGVGLTLLWVFCWIPQRLVREVDSIGNDMVSRAGAMLTGAAISVASAAGGGGQSTAPRVSSSSGGGVGGGGGGGQLGASPWGGGGGGSPSMTAKQQAQQSSANYYAHGRSGWGQKP